MVGGNAVEEAFKMMTYGVYIIGTAAAGKINGMTAAWVTRVSVDPPLLLVAISKGHYTTELIRASRVFSVNLVSPQQAELAAKCGSVSGRICDKLVDEEIEYGETGAPILTEAAAWLDCEEIDEFECGDHICFVGRVVGAGKRSEQALMYRKGSMQPVPAQNDA